MAENGRLHVTAETRSDAFQGRTHRGASHKRGQAGPPVIKQRLPATAVGKYPASTVAVGLQLPLHQRRRQQECASAGSWQQGPRASECRCPNCPQPCSSAPLLWQAPHRQKLLRGASVLPRTSAAKQKHRPPSPGPSTRLPALTLHHPRRPSRRGGCSCRSTLLHASAPTLC